MQISRTLFFSLVPEISRHPNARLFVCIKSRYQVRGVPKWNAAFILSWTAGRLSRFMLHRTPIVTRHQIHLVPVMDSQQRLPLARERVALTMLPWIPRPVRRGSRGRPLRALAAVSDCWLMARPAEAEQPGCRCPLLRLEQGCSFWISPITVYPDVRRTPLLTDRHYSCFSLPAEKIIQLKPTQFLLRETLLWLTSVFAAHKV